MHQIINDHIQEEGTDINGAIRDILTDLLHTAKRHNIDLDERLVSAKEVFEQEICETTPEYWDCECETNYIHKKSVGNYCPKCKTFKTDQPDSRVLEVKSHKYVPANDNAIKKEQ